MSEVELSSPAEGHEIPVPFDVVIVGANTNNYRFLAQDGFVGPQGDQGPRGFPGAQGPAGVQGAQGPRGFQGFQGNTGPQGPKGDTGTGGGGVVSSITLSPAFFDYFTAIYAPPLIWIGSAAQNSQSFINTTHDYGTKTFYASAGTYSVAFIYITGVDRGIISISFNGGAATDIDDYGTDTNFTNSYQFSVTLLEGANTVNISVSAKNALSSAYLISFGGDIVLNKT